MSKTKTKTRYIVIPLMDHTGDDEVADILAELNRQGFHTAPYLAAGEPPAAMPFVRRCSCGEPEDGGEFGWFDAADGVTRCNACGEAVSS